MKKLDVCINAFPFEGKVARPGRLAVPEKCFGLTLILAFFDRCGNCAAASSATGSAAAQFPTRDGSFSGLARA